MVLSLNPKELIVHIVVMVKNNRVLAARVCESFDAAVTVADDWVMSEMGVTNHMPDWEMGGWHDFPGGKPCGMSDGCPVSIGIVECGAIETAVR